MIDRKRLVAPREHLGILVEPDPRPLLAQAAAARRGADTQVGAWALPLAAMRAAVRQRLQLTPPVIATGHQAEFFHPGVLAKSLAAAELARQRGGSPVFLVVDTDLPKSPGVRVPRRTSTGWSVATVELPGFEATRPVACQRRADRSSWKQFFGALRLGRSGDVLDAFEAAWLSTAPQGEIDYCRAWMAGESAAETALGAGGIRFVRVSELSRWPEFRAFAAALTSDAAAVAGAYNAAQNAYRRRHRVRNEQRPAPPLAIEGDLIESPFWAFHPGIGRVHLRVQRRGAATELLADRTPIARLNDAELNDAAAHANGWPFEREGWSLWPRALTLSGFARLALADLFIHGVGGAKYDEMTETWLSAMGGGLCPMCCVTATLLPAGATGAPPDSAALRRAERELHFNPQRCLRTAPADLVQRRQALIQESDALRRAAAASPQIGGRNAARHGVFMAIRAINEAIVAACASEASAYRAALQQRRAQVTADGPGRDRENFYGLYPDAMLADLAGRIRTALS